MDYDDFCVQPAVADEENAARLIQVRFSELVEYEGGRDELDPSEIYSLMQFHLARPGVMFRSRREPSEMPVCRWLANVYSKSLEIIAREMPRRYVPLTKEDLRDIAHLSIETDIVKRLPALMLSRGIVLVYHMSTKGLKVDGVSFASETGHLVLGVSFRYPRIDHFWFTLLHELAHAFLQHGEIRTPAVVELDSSQPSKEEVAANALAKSTFVPRHIWANCPPKYERTESAVKKFAYSQNVHPAIIAGMLQHEQGDYSIYRTLVDSVDLRKLVFG